MDLPDNGQPVRKLVGARGERHCPHDTREGVIESPNDGSGKAMKDTRAKTWLLFISCGLLSFVAAPTHGVGAVAFISLIPLLHAVRMTTSYRTAFIGGLLAG